MMPPPPDLHNKQARASWNATSLAFLGDSVWEVGFTSRNKFLVVVVHTCDNLSYPSP